MEKWKEITGYEGYYSVSNYGRIKSLSRNVGYNLKESILTLNISKVGYITVDLYKTIKDAAFDTFQKTTSNIVSCCRGKRVFAGGYKWRYAI